MAEEQRADAAGALLEAYASRRPIGRLTETYPDLDLSDAYAIQLLQTQSWRANGAVIKGRKVGLTSAVMQRQMGVEQPDYGVLRADMFYPEFGPIPATAFVQPRIEPEIAFVLARDLQGPGVTIAEAARAVDFVLPALEIIDSRIEGWNITIGDTIADNASSGGVVLGSHPAALGQVELRLAGCNLYRDGELAATGAGGAVLGSPLLSLAWLANVLGGHGTGLAAGEVVLPGSMTASQTVSPGQTWTAQIAGLGSVTARFEGERP